MSKYSTNTSYIYYPGTDIPINFNDIKDKEILDETERTLLFASYMKFNKKLNSKTIFDQNFLIKLHKETFGKLYPFAGKYRDKNVTKGETNFCFAINIQSEMDRLFNELKEEGYLKKGNNLSKELFAERLAYYTCELIAIHPFFEFNGRIIRLFIDLIAAYNGYEYIEYPDVTDEGGNPFIDASIDCMIADCRKMYEIILNGLHYSDS